MDTRGDIGTAWRLAVRLRREHGDRDAPVERYARRLLVELDADPARLAAVATACRRRELRARRRPFRVGRPRTWSAAAQIGKTAAFWAAHGGGRPVG